MKPNHPLRVFDPGIANGGTPSSPKTAGADLVSELANLAEQQREAELDRELDLLTGECESETVAITLGQMVPLVIDAANNNRLWLNDFSDEVVEIDADLYEVLLAYSRMRQRDAA